MKKILRILRWALIGVLALIVLLVIGFVVYSQVATNDADPTAEAALASSSEVEVLADDWLTFRPVDSEPTTGLIFYPGGLVDPRAYAPLAHEIAAAGYLVVIPPMPLNFAFLNVDAAQQVIEAYPEIAHWAVGGHSLGGAMAAQFIKDNPWAAEGLALWAAYPGENADISCRMLKAVSIYGTEDGLSTPAKIQARQELLPPDTEYVAIEGGNHAQFGWYGPQANDGVARIDPLDQQAQTVEATVALLASLGE